MLALLIIALISFLTVPVGMPPSYQSDAPIYDLIYYINDQAYYFDRLTLESIPIDFPLRYISLSPNQANPLLYDRISECVFDSSFTLKWCMPSEEYWGQIFWMLDGQSFWITTIDGILQIDAYSGDILRTLKIKDFGLSFPDTYTVGISELALTAGLATIETENGNNLFIINLDTESTLKSIIVPKYNVNRGVNADIRGTSFSPNGKTLVYLIDCFGKDFCDSEFIILDLQTNVETHISAIFDEGELGNISQIKWSPDGQRFAFVTHAGRSGFGNRTYIYDLTTQDFEILSEGYSQAGPETLLWSPNGDFAQSICQVPQWWECEIDLFLADGQNISLLDLQSVDHAGIITWIPRGWLQIEGVPSLHSSD